MTEPTYAEPFGYKATVLTIVPQSRAENVKQRYKGKKTFKETQPLVGVKPTTSGSIVRWSTTVLSQLSAKKKSELTKRVCQNFSHYFGYN